MFNVHCISVLNFVILKWFWRFKSSGRAAREDNLMRGKKLIPRHGGLVPILAWVLPGSSLSWWAMVLVIKVEAWWQDEMMLKMKTVNWPLPQLDKLTTGLCSYPLLKMEFRDSCQIPKNIKNTTACISSIYVGRMNTKPFCLLVWHSMCK